MCAPTQNHQPIHLAFTCTYLWLVVGLPFSTAIFLHVNLMHIFIRNMNRLPRDRSFPDCWLVPSLWNHPYDGGVRDQGSVVKGSPVGKSGSRFGGGDFHFQHGFFEMWVTKALNGDREQAQLFLAFGSGYVGRERFPTARAQSACAGGRLVGGAWSCRPLSSVTHPSRFNISTSYSALISILSYIIP